MRIGVDASRAFVNQPTGTERYAWEMVKNLISLSETKNDKFLLYVRDELTDEQKRLVQSLRSTLNNFEIVRIPLRYLWTQVGLAARTWVDGLDWLWVPAHTLPVLRKPGTRTLVTIHGIEYEWLPAYENGLQKWYLPLSTKYAVWSADKIVAVSEFTKQQLMERLGADETKMEVVTEGFDVRTTGHGQKSLENYGLDKKKYLLFVGTVQPRKNLERLIEAFAKVSVNLGGRDDESIKLVIAGKLGWSYEGVLAAPKKFGVENRVKILGYVNEEERQHLLRNALAYVQPSVTEGFGLPVWEAMAEGVPVITSSGGALKEIVTGLDGQLAAEVFDPTNVGGMTEALNRVMGSERLREELVEKGKKLVVGRTWKRAAKEIYRVLQD